MEHPVIRRTESHFSGALGYVLLRRAWLPVQPRGVLLLVHGYAEHSGRYERFGAWFAKRGCAVHAYDHQGHGGSQGHRCHVRRFGDLLDDLGILLGCVRSDHPGVPLFLVGHSMGGLVVAAFARERHPDIAGAVTSGAALLVFRDVSRARIFAARVLRYVMPRLALDGGLDPNGLSRDPEIVRAYLEDPLVYRKITVSLVSEFFAAAQRTVSGGADVRIPMLLLHGEDDPICPVEGSRVFSEQLSVPGSGLRTYPQLRHEIFNEPERETVFEDLLEWVRARTS